MNKFLLFLRGCALGILFFGIILFFSDGGLLGEKSLSHILAIIGGILLFGYSSMKFPEEFWKAWLPKKEA
ncbi:MAG: hypothetical protein CL670_16855 [Balneola sp.]|jgi:hypothetical protein|nr:hypothetical protein [Balneola sp.]MBE80833.1 hypothetical protein [Balneola sp.]HBX66705.1 hypothetical protein [Balneolaceae bacterium]|tara:strand:+ start:1256 stop:1465 length:210 start_codon:yes stop_codon:yes gene_type:complete